MTQINKDKPVMVTGATGYVAGHLIKLLLEAGLTVHAPIRNPDDKGKTQYLDGLAEASKGKIVYFKADLLENGSYDKAMEGCELVYHTASPFTMAVQDPVKDLIEPALLGTKNVLEAANRVTSVNRVVLTSSCAAIIGDTADLLDLPNCTATEEIWNESSTEKHQPYSYSKTIAEKEAWKINEAQSRWDLVTINPTLVLGPGINPNGTSESFNIFKQLGDGTMKAGVPNLDIGTVDVRDVAEAHYKAGFTASAKGRHLVSAKSITLLEMAKILDDHFGDAYPFPKKELPKFMVWLVGPFVGMPRKMVSRNIGYPWKVDNSKAKKELGIEFKQPEEYVVSFFQQLIDSGYFKAP
ncbi:MAG: NAD-dependent epimerase/dehydratase family protein [SAR324 cluster bacterium]|nr:NAD-dependent epimerase/dehydratase family protein [SAR324 cluster bacterium]